MCHYVTAVLPRSADHARLDAIARDHGRCLERLPNPRVEAQIGPDEQYFFTTVGHCDCGTPLGAFARRHRDAPDWPALEQRLLRKGWSKAKVARSIAQKQEDHRAESEVSEADHRRRLSDWMDFIGAVLGPGKASHVGLLLHMYSGSINAGFELEGRQDIRMADLTAKVLANMKEDVLHVFRH